MSERREKWIWWVIGEVLFGKSLLAMTALRKWYRQGQKSPSKGDMRYETHYGARMEHLDSGKKGDIPRVNQAVRTRVMERLCHYFKGSPLGSGPKTDRLMSANHCLQWRLVDTEGGKNQGKGRSIVPFIRRPEAKKNLKRRHLWLLEGSTLVTTWRVWTVWCNVQTETWK